MRRRSTAAERRRDILFWAGLAGITYETVVEHADRPYLLAVFGAMVGLAPILDYTQAKVTEYTRKLTKNGNGNGDT